MKATFTCPKCGRTGSLKKQLPAGATLAVVDVKRPFYPSLAGRLLENEGVSESVIEQFLGPPISKPLPEPPVQDDESMGAPTPPQRSSPTAVTWKDHPVLDSDDEPPPIPRSHTTTPSGRKPSLVLVIVSGGAVFCLGVVTTIIF